MKTLKQYAGIICVMTTLVLLGGCGVDSDLGPKQPPTSKTYSIYTNQNKGFKITQLPGVIDMITGLSR